MIDLLQLEYAVAQRRYYVNEDVNATMSATIQEFLFQCQSSRKPVDIFISTGGGCADDGMVIGETIREQPYLVRTIAMGEVASSGLWVLAAGDERLAKPSSSFIWHEMTLSSESNRPSEMREMNKRFAGFYKDACKALCHWTDNPDIIKKLGSFRALSVQEAVQLNLLTGIYQ